MRLVICISFTTTRLIFSADANSNNNSNNQQHFNYYAHVMNSLARRRVVLEFPESDARRPRLATFWRARNE